MNSKKTEWNKKDYEIAKLLLETNSINQIQIKLKVSFERVKAVMGNEKYKEMQRDLFSRLEEDVASASSDFVNKHIILFNKSYHILNDKLEKWLEKGVPEQHIFSLVQTLDKVSTVLSKKFITERQEIITDIELAPEIEGEELEV